jgi:hypothetical protein
VGEQSPTIIPEVLLQPNYEINIHPIDLSSHGKTPAGLPMYRVVWANTRKTKLLYKGKFHIIPRYLPDAELNTGEHWILERWKSAEEFVGMSKQRYQEMASQFPWAPSEVFPIDGEYDFEFGFEAEVDEDIIRKALMERAFRITHVSLAERIAEATALDVVEEKRKDVEFENLYEKAREESFTL